MLRSTQNKSQLPQQQHHLLTRRVSSSNGYDTKTTTTTTLPLPHVMGLPFKTFLVVLFLFVIVVIFGTVNILLINLQNDNTDANLHSHDFNSFMRGSGGSSLRRITGGFGSSSSSSDENLKLKEQLKQITDELATLKQQQQQPPTNTNDDNDDQYSHNPEYLDGTHMSLHNNNPTNYFYANSSNFITLPFLPDQPHGISFFLWIYLHPLDDAKRKKRTIITTKKSASCGEDSRGYRFYVADDGDDDGATLVLELTADDDSCLKVASPAGFRIPSDEWIHVGFTIDNADGVRLYLGGEVVVYRPRDKEFRLDERLVATDKSGDGHFIGRGLLVRGSGVHEEVVAEALGGHVALMGFTDTVLGVEDMAQIYKASEVELVRVLMRVQLVHRDKTVVLYTCRGLHNDKVTFDLPEIIHGLPGRIHQNYTEHLRFTPPTYKTPGGKTDYAYHDGSYAPNITTSMKDESDELSRTTRRPAIRAAMEHAWSGYKKYAWGKDEIRPLSKDGIDRWRGMAMTLVDALDTLWLMGMTTEFNEARDWIRDNMDFDKVGEVSVFETTIRHLGGLLAAYDWSKDEVFLNKAEDLGQRLLVAFNSPSGMPYNNVVLSSKLVKKSVSAGLSEVGTLQMEFRHLAHLTGKQEYATKVDKIFEDLQRQQPETGLYPVLVGVQKREVMVPKQGRITFGAVGDSFYEYLLKTWIQGGKTEMYLREMYDKAIEGMHEHLVMTSKPSGFTFVAEMTLPKQMDKKMDHLACFLGGTLALGAYTDPRGLESERAQRDLATAKALTYTCYQMYTRTRSGLAPEFVRFPDGSDMSIPQNAHYYLLRPETVESFYYLHVLTGDPVYREWGWNVFQALEANCKTEVGYGAYANVQIAKAVPKDEMESFFLAETLKYLYLLFDPDSEVDILNKHVFNTEAHPLTRIDLLPKNEQRRD